MGMFDYVYWNGVEYQTKDFDNCLDVYHISPRNELYRHDDSNNYTIICGIRLSFTGSIKVIRNDYKRFQFTFSNGVLIGASEICA